MKATKMVTTMLKEAAVYYGIRTLWTGTGLYTTVLGASVTEDWHTKAILVLSGLLTTFVSLLFGGFIKHLAGHQNDRNLIFDDLNKKHERMLNLLEKSQTKESCVQVHTSMVELLDVKLKGFEDKLTIALKKE